MVTSRSYGHQSRCCPTPQHAPPHTHTLSRSSHGNEPQLQPSELLLLPEPVSDSARRAGSQQSGERGATM